ncbi:MAG TPA: hypothetical protein VE642_14260 [Pyrinomonadaceae bacterium]|nr:hypothetical protein [Pyrinomonadaceae bacterium]
MAEVDISEITFDDLVGKVILIGVTYTDARDNIRCRKQWWGTVEKASTSEGIRVRLSNSSETPAFPPDLRAVRRAAPGEYRLKESGEVVTDPDFLATWICVEPDAET